MIKNAQSLMDKCRNVANQNQININEVLQNYMFESILERLSKSKYKENFIIKGGILLSSIMGINIRTTMDMDTTIVGIKMDKEELKKILSDILEIDNGDGISYKIVGVENIKDEDLYGGFRYKIESSLENIKVNLSIDIATGDKITPKAIEYKYKCLFEDRYLDLISYNLETILAEKFNSVISIGVVNSRMKDYYDIYYLMNFKKDEINKNVLKQAIINTFEYQKTDIAKINEVFDKIKNSERLKEQWKIYSKKHKYSENLDFEETIASINKLVQLF